MRSKEMPEGADEKSRHRWRKKWENALLHSSGFCSLTFPGSFTVGSGTWLLIESKRVWSLTSDQAFSGFYRRLAQGRVRRGRETKQPWSGSLEMHTQEYKVSRGERWLHVPLNSNSFGEILSGNGTWGLHRRLPHKQILQAGWKEEAESALVNKQPPMRLSW